MSIDGDATALEGIAKQPVRHPWLLSRVFAVDIMTRPRCRSAMRLVKLADSPISASVPVRLRGQPLLASSSSTSPRDRPDSEQAVMVEPRLGPTDA